MGVWAWVWARTWVQSAVHGWGPLRRGRSTCLTCLPCLEVAVAHAVGLPLS